MQRLLILGIAMIVFLAGCHQAPPVQEIRASEGDVSESKIVANDNEWPRWRGSNQDGKSLAEDPPIEWSETDQIVWRANVPGRGHSSPIVAQDRVFLTTADEESEEQIVLCYDRNTGNERWRTTAHRGGFMRMHGKNSHASATPAWDGERLHAVFINSDELWLTTVDLEGKIIWQQAAGRFRSEHGYGSSPALYKSLVIVCGDNAGRSFLAALDRSTGKVVWRTARQRPGRHGNYATPIVVNLAGKPQLLLAGHGKLTSYNPDTGELIWYCDGPAEVAACTVACSDDMVFATGGYPEKEILGLRGDGSGDVSTSHVVWRARKGVTYVPSPVYHNGHLYVVNDQGIASCFEAETGKLVWQERLSGRFSASPVFAGGRLFASSETGTTFVFNAAPKFELVGENKLGGGYFASPAICGSQIFLRTRGQLCCIGP